MNNVKKQSKAEKIRVLLAEGMSVKDIAKKLNYTDSYVAQVKWHWKKDAKPPVIKTKKMPTKLKKEQDEFDRLNPPKQEELKDDTFVGWLRDRTEQIRKELDLSAEKDSWVAIHEEDEFDPVNSPSHYKVGGIETIDFIEAKGLNYRLGNVIKYVTRAGHKLDAVEDLMKARWYLDREIDKLNAELDGTW